MPKAIRRILNIYRSEKGDLLLVQAYHEATWEVGFDEISAWLSSSVLDAIDTAEENLIHSR